MKLLSYLLYVSFAAVVVMTVWLALTAEPYSNEFGQPPKDWNRDTTFTEPFVTKQKQDSLQWKPVLIAPN